MLKKIARYLQPAGFALLLLFLIFSKFPLAKILFWAGLMLSIAGTFAEIWFFQKIPRSKRTQNFFIFLFGIIVKFLLIMGIALRVYEVPYSLYFLLTCIVLAFIWGVLGLFIKPVADGNEDILDVK